MKKIKWWKGLFVLPLIPILCYIAGYISQFIINYRQWQAGGENGSPAFPSFMPMDCLKAVMTLTSAFLVNTLNWSLMGLILR